DDPWLNGLDEFVMMASLFARKVARDGQKEGRRRTITLDFGWLLLGGIAAFVLFAFYGGLVTLAAAVTTWIGWAMWRRRDGQRVISEATRDFEDSNLTFERLERYFTEYAGLLRKAMARGDQAEFERLLRQMGVRPRAQMLDPTRIDLAYFDTHDTFPDGKTAKLPVEEVMRHFLDEMGSSPDLFDSFAARYQAFKSREEMRPAHWVAIIFARFLPYGIVTSWGGLTFRSWFMHTEIAPSVSMSEYAWSLLAAPGWWWAVGILGSLLVAASWASAYWRRYRLQHGTAQVITGRPTPWRRVSAAMAQAVSATAPQARADLQRVRTALQAAAPQSPVAALALRAAQGAATAARAAAAALRPYAASVDQRLAALSPDRWLYGLSWLVRVAFLVGLLGVMQSMTPAARLDFAPEKLGLIWFVQGMIALELMGLVLPLVANRIAPFRFKIGAIELDPNISHQVRPTSIFWLSARYFFSLVAPSGGASIFAAIVSWSALFTISYGAGVLTIGAVWPWFHQHSLALWEPGVVGASQWMRATQLLFGFASLVNTMFMQAYSLFLGLTVLSGMIAFLWAKPLRWVLVGIPGMVLLHHLTQPAISLFWKFASITSDEEYLTFLGWGVDRVVSVTSNQLLGMAADFWQRLSQTLTLQSDSWVALAIGTLSVIGFVRQVMMPLVQERDRRRSLASKAKTLIALPSVDRLSSHVFYPLPKGVTDPVQFATNKMLGFWRYLRDHADSPEIHAFRDALGLGPGSEERQLHEWFTALHQAEWNARVTLWHPVQLDRPSLGRLYLRHDPAQREMIERAWHLRNQLFLSMGGTNESLHTGYNLVARAIAAQEAGLAGKLRFLLILNKYNPNQPRPSEMMLRNPATESELTQRAHLAALLEQFGVEADSKADWTPFAWKAGAVNATAMIDPEVTAEARRLFTDVRSMEMMDRQEMANDLASWVRKIHRARGNPHLVTIVQERSVSSALGSAPISGTGRDVEQGHTLSAQRGLSQVMGGASGDFLLTGWGSGQRILEEELQLAFAKVHEYEVAPVTTRMVAQEILEHVERYQGLWKLWGFVKGTSLALWNMRFGLKIFATNSWGPSEDLEAGEKTAAAYSSLGEIPRSSTGEGLHHKTRERASHISWFAAYARWAGGALLAAHDLTMQSITAFGPFSVFAKEMRAFSGTFFSGTFFFFFNVAFMPFAVWWDLTPFSGALLLLWLPGMLHNQMLAMHKLPAFIQSKGWVLGSTAWAAERWHDLQIFSIQSAVHLLGQVNRMALAFTLGGEAERHQHGLRMWQAIRGRRTAIFSHQPLRNLQTGETTRPSPRAQTVASSGHRFVRWGWVLRADFWHLIVLLGQGERTRPVALAVVRRLTGSDDLDVARRQRNEAVRAALWRGAQARAQWEEARQTAAQLTVREREAYKVQPFPEYQSVANIRTVFWMGAVLSALNLISLAQLEAINALLLFPTLIFSFSLMAAPFRHSAKWGMSLGAWEYGARASGWLLAGLIATSVSFAIRFGMAMPVSWVGALGLLVGLWAFYGRVYVPMQQRYEHQLSRAEESDGNYDLVSRTLGRQLRLTSEFFRSLVMGAGTLTWVFIVPMPPLWVFKSGPYLVALPFTTVLVGLIVAVAGVIAAGTIARYGMHVSMWRVERAYVRAWRRYQRTKASLPLAQRTRIDALFTKIETHIAMKEPKYARVHLRQIRRELGRWTAQQREAPPAPTVPEADVETLLDRTRRSQGTAAGPIRRKRGGVLEVVGQGVMTKDGALQATDVASGKDRWVKDLLSAMTADLTSLICKACDWSGVSLQVVRGNDRLAHFERSGKTIALDVDLLEALSDAKTAEAARALATVELTHELRHAMLELRAGRSPPRPDDTSHRGGPALEELIISLLEVQDFLRADVSIRESILKLLAADNDYDDQQFGEKVLRTAHEHGLEAALTPLIGYLTDTRIYPQLADSFAALRSQTPDELRRLINSLNLNIDAATLRQLAVILTVAKPPRGNGPDSGGLFPTGGQRGILTPTPRMILFLGTASVGAGWLGQFVAQVLARGELLSALASVSVTVLAGAAAAAALWWWRGTLGKSRETTAPPPAPTAPAPKAAKQYAAATGEASSSGSVKEALPQGASWLDPELRIRNYRVGLFYQRWLAWAETPLTFFLTDWLLPLDTQGWEVLFMPALFLAPHGLLNRNALLTRGLWRLVAATTGLGFLDAGDAAITPLALIMLTLWHWRLDWRAARTDDHRRDLGSREERAVNAEIDQAQREGRGRLLQGSHRLHHWLRGRPQELHLLREALALLHDHPDVILPHGLGTLRMAEVLPTVNIILIDPKAHAPPGLWFRNRRTFQVSHVGAVRHAIYLDALTFHHLTPRQRAALLLHDLILLTTKERSRVRWGWLAPISGRRWRFMAWRSALVQAARHRAEEVERSFIGAGASGQGSQLDDAIDELFSYALDHWLHVSTDHFYLDERTSQLENRRPGHLPVFGAALRNNPYYMNVENVMAALGQASTLYLDELDIAGAVRLPGAILRGTVRITCRDPGEDGAFNLDSTEARAALGMRGNAPLILEDVSIYISPGGHISTTHIAREAAHRLPLGSARRKLERALRPTYKAALFDLDGTLTVAGRDLPLEAVELLIELLRAGVPVGIITARSLHGDRQGKGAKASAVIEAVTAYLVADRMSADERERLLRLLYLLPENGSYLVRASKPQRIVPLLHLPKKQIPAQDEVFVGMVERQVQEWAYQRSLTLAAATVGRKEYTISLRQVSREHLESLARAIRYLIRSRHEPYLVTRTADSLDIEPPGGGKGLGLQGFLATLREDFPHEAIAHEEIATFGDRGDRAGADFPMLNRLGGFSVGEADPSSPQAPVADVVGLRGWPATQWVLGRLAFTHRPREAAARFSLWDRPALIAVAIVTGLVVGGAIVMSRSWLEAIPPILAALFGAYLVARQAVSGQLQHEWRYIWGRLARPPKVLRDRFTDLRETEDPGVSATRTFTARFREPGQHRNRLFIKYSDVTDSFDGNDRRWLEAQAKRLLEVEGELPPSVRALFPSVLAFESTPDYAYYVMPLYPRSRSFAQYFLERPYGTTSGFEARVSRIFAALAEQFYGPHLVPGRRGYVRRAYLERMRARLASAQQHTGAAHDRMLRGHPVTIGGTQYANVSYWFEELMRQERIVINGRVYPNLPRLLEALEREAAWLEELEPQQLVTWYHGDLTIENMLIDMDGRVRLMDMRTTGMPDGLGDIVYDLGKFAFSFLYTLVHARQIQADVTISVDERLPRVRLRMNRQHPGVGRMLDFDDQLMDWLERQPDLMRLLSADANWQERLELARAVHLVSTIPSMLNVDPTGQRAMAMYAVGTVMLAEVLSKYGVIDLPHPWPTTVAQLAEDLTPEQRKTIERPSSGSWFANRTYIRGVAWLLETLGLYLGLTWALPGQEGWVGVLYPLLFLVLHVFNRDIRQAVRERNWVVLRYVLWLTAAKGVVGLLMPWVGMENMTWPVRALSIAHLLVNTWPLVLRMLARLGWRGPELRAIWKHLQAGTSKFAYLGRDAGRDRLGAFKIFGRLLDDPAILTRELQDYIGPLAQRQHLVVGAMGGASLSMKTYLQVAPFTEALTAQGRSWNLMDSTNPATIDAFWRNLTGRPDPTIDERRQALAQTTALFVSESGRTVETESFFDYLTAACQEVGLDPTQHVILLTHAGSGMQTGAKYAAYRKVDIQIDGGTDIGGRFMPPGVRASLWLLGILVDDQLPRVLAVARAMHAYRDAAKDPWLAAGVRLAELAQGGRDMVSFLWPASLQAMHTGTKQLFEESLGKDLKGVTLVSELPARENLVLANKSRRVFIHVRIEGQPDEFAAYLDEARTLGYEVLDLVIPPVPATAFALDETAAQAVLVSAAFFGAQKTVAALAWVWDINLVTQPGVDGYKRAMLAARGDAPLQDLLGGLDEANHLTWEGLHIVLDGLLPMLDSRDREEIAALRDGLSAPALVAELIRRAMRSRAPVESLKLRSYERLTPDWRAQLEAVADALERSTRAIGPLADHPVMVTEGPTDLHISEQNDAQGRDHTLTIQVIAEHHAPASVGVYADQQLQRAIVGTHRNRVDNLKRRTLLVTMPDTSEQSQKIIRLFFEEVAQHLQQDETTRRPSGVSTDSDRGLGIRPWPDGRLAPREQMRAHRYGPFGDHDQGLMSLFTGEDAAEHPSRPDNANGWVLFGQPRLDFEVTGRIYRVGQDPVIDA
ncbi:MAG: hypothetical protein HY598_02170, partial [Candidatus Omnitrophica bacterium]|nr:hypothetical protein [Candidatus Omnitrophota bacterium]